MSAHIDISHHHIQQWQEGFVELNRARLERARALLNSRQRLVLDVLPLLLHVNHPRLPGFVGHDTVAGIANFQPNAQHLQALQQLAKGIGMPRLGHARQQPITGLYSMGSLGSLAQARGSDLDVWLCHQSSLTTSQRESLQRKCQHLEQWAGTYGLELHFFLMDLTQFRQGVQQATAGEDCGSSQHQLLLDEFYRSAIWLAGGQPRWWLIPNAQQRDAEALWQQLCQRHLVNDEQWVDFGALPTISPAEFIGAGLWQLTKGLHSPYKSLLKLLLTRHYASQYPNIQPLCNDLKANIHAGNSNVDANDAYLLLLARLSEQLQTEGNPQRLQLLHRAFYIKTQLRLSEASQAAERSWRSERMNALAQSWGWRIDDLRELDQRKQWSALRISQERNKLISEMLSSYRFLAGFSQKYATHVHINKDDMHLLGNQLYAAFDARPGKVIHINPGISDHLEQEKISLTWQHEHWSLHTINSQERQLQLTPADEPLRQSPSLIELLCFAQLNALSRAHTHISLEPQPNPVSAYELKELTNVIRQIVPPVVPQSHFRQPPRIEQWHVFINVGIDPQQHLSRRGMQKLSSRNDSLGYSGVRENLVQTLDVLTLNSWGEWHVQRFVGDHALMLCLQQLLQQEAHRGEWHVHCFCATRAATIRLRVQQLCQAVFQHMREQPKHPYLVEVAKQYFLFEVDKRGLQLRHASNVTQLLALLQRNQAHFVHYTLDSEALQQSPLRPIFERTRAGIWQLFYWLTDTTLFFYALDEKGALLHQQWPRAQALTQLRNVIRFLHQLDQRWQGQQGRVNQRTLLLYELRRDPGQFDYKVIRRKLPTLLEQAAHIDVRAALDEQQQLTLYCNGQEFPAWQHQQHVYREVAEHIQRLRQTDEHYPCYLNDLSLPNQSSMILHLRWKQRIEKQLNEALEPR